MNFAEFLRFFRVFFFRFFDFFKDFWVLWVVLGFCEMYWIFLDFLFCFFEIPFKVTKVTTKNYPDYYWRPKIAKNRPKQHNKLFNALWSPQQELEEGPRCGLYLFVKITFEQKNPGLGVRDCQTFGALLKDFIWNRWNKITLFQGLDGFKRKKI